MSKKKPQKKTVEQKVPQKEIREEIQEEIKEEIQKEIQKKASENHSGKAKSTPKESSSEQDLPKQTKQKKSAEQDVPKQTEELEKRCSNLETENQELKEALLRKQADFENYRRRIQKDKEEAIQFANRKLIGELLEVLDNFERALDSHENEKESSSAMQTLFEGLQLVEKQLVDILSSRWGLKSVESVGQEFDPNLHEALMMEESSEYQVATVVEDLQTGYTLHDRVLRPAKVKVAKPKN